MPSSSRCAWTQSIPAAQSFRPAGQRPADPGRAEDVQRDVVAVGALRRLDAIRHVGWRLTCPFGRHRGVQALEGRMAGADELGHGLRVGVPAQRRRRGVPVEPVGGEGGPQARVEPGLGTQLDRRVGQPSLAPGFAGVNVS